MEKGNEEKQIVIGRALCRAPLAGMSPGQLLWGFPELQLRESGEFGSEACQSDPLKTHNGGLRRPNPKCQDVFTENV